MHSVVQSGNKTGSFILGVLSFYTGLQVVALLKSLSKRPIFIDIKKQELILKFGILSKAVIPFSEIKEIEISAKDLPEKTTIKYFSPLGSMTGHNIIVHLKNELKFEIFYGFKKKATSLAIFLDDKVSFKNKLSELILENSNQK